MLEPTVGRFRVEAAIPGIAGADDVIIVDPNKRGIIVKRWVSWSKYPNLMEHRDRLRSMDTSPSSEDVAPATIAADEPEDPQEPARSESEQLMPMEAFDAMADALGPLAHGLQCLRAGQDELASCYKNSPRRRPPAKPSVALSPGRLRSSP